MQMSVAERHRSVRKLELLKRERSRLQKLLNNPRDSKSLRAWAHQYMDKIENDELFLERILTSVQRIKS